LLSPLIISELQKKLFYLIFPNHKILPGSDSTILN